MREAILLTVLAVVACGTAPKAPPEAPETWRIELPANVGYAVGVSEGGEPEVEVTVPGGHPHSGVYHSTNRHIIDALRDAMSIHGQPGVKTAIEVDGRGEIQLVSSSATKL